MKAFSPYNPDTRQLQPYIKVAFRKHVLITGEAYRLGVVIENDIPYVLQLGPLAINALDTAGVFAGPVSFQQHEGANYAITL